jgi:uncharacterized protein YcbX
MYLAEIWRYPVKSMAGECLDHATVGPLGLEGDRTIVVADRNGRVVTARTHPKLLAHKATIDAAGQPHVDGRLWTDPGVQADVERIVGPGARLIRDVTAGRFDAEPLLVATDGAIAAFGYDGRRLRSNLVLGGVNGLDERGWPGRGLRIGEVVLALRELCERCVMTTFDPDTLEQDHDVLRRIASQFGSRLAVYAAGIREGVIHRGQTVELEV